MGIVNDFVFFKKWMSIVHPSVLVAKNCDGTAKKTMIIKVN